ncbi:unnamed protein product [Clavelina lepadiformis]|uniref:Prolactin receptor n=1 Tax=Clavelina lepadiformis TaxID=159417 RepID=A0ABP0F8N4_CLALP
MRTPTDYSATETESLSAQGDICQDEPTLCDDSAIPVKLEQKLHKTRKHGKNKCSSPQSSECSSIPILRSGLNMAG